MDVAARTRSAGARPYRFFDTLESRKDASRQLLVGSWQWAVGSRTAHCLLPTV
jgi:hypothetical protein